MCTGMTREILRAGQLDEGQLAYQHHLLSRLASISIYSLIGEWRAGAAR